jgi:hypothetical protein
MKVKQSKLTNEKGLFSTEKYKKGDVLYTLSGEVYSEPTRETIHIGDNKHIYDKYGIYINHSFNPNICIKDQSLVALCDIEIDDELFFNYNDTEINMAKPFYVNCVLVCGNQNCTSTQ